MEDLSHNVVAGLNWLRQNKPHIDWDTSVLTVQQPGVSFQVYPKNVELLLRDTVFVRITESNESSKDSEIEWETWGLEVVRHAHQPEDLITVTGHTCS